ncbi:MAG: Nramp family divalent metal transporter [Chloroflexi bacterium]|nr:Nramp family divalent metal transporter [Chloroflexota bacterium]
MENKILKATGGETWTTRARTVKSPFARNILTYLMVFGPGLIVMQADNDAGAVSTYTQAGAQYGFHLLWILLLLLPVTYFVQEMVTRLGIATGRGHAAMIYQRFGKWWGHFSLFDLELVNFLTLVTEFAAISLALSGFGVSPYISVPIAAIGLIIMVITGSYLRWERVAIFLCLLDIAWLAFVIVLRGPAGATFGAVFGHVAVPSLPPGGLSGNLVFLIIAIVGTTIAPWQLFFEQSCVADKRLRFSDLKFSRLDTFIGATMAILVAGCMMIVGNVLFTNNITYSDPAQMAEALVPFAGDAMKYGILLLMVNAAVLGTTVISLSSSWAYSEVKGWSHSLHRPFKEQKGFYSFYIGSVLVAAGIVLIPNLPLQLVIVSVQVLAGLMLPVAIIFLQLLLNDRALLGERFANKPWNNVINWTVIFVLFGLSATLAVQVLLPGVIPTT